MIARRIACTQGTRFPAGEILAVGYGFPLGKLVRSLAPPPAAEPGPGGARSCPSTSATAAGRAAPPRDPNRG